MQNPLLEEVDEVTESEDLAKEDSPEETANEEAEDPAEEDPIDWTDYMQDGAFDRAYIPQGEAGAEVLEKVQVTRTSLAESLLEQVHFLSLPPDRLTLAEFLIGSLDDRGYPARRSRTWRRRRRDARGLLKVLTLIQALRRGRRRGDRGSAC
jgi:DNA-directed RNA polymerase specialized sigma54-like protein